MRSSNKISVIGVAIGLLIFSVTARTALAGGGSDTSSTTALVTTGDTSTPSPNPSPSPSPIGTTSSSNSLTQVNQQSGIVQVNGYASTLTPPSCNGGCFFAVTRASPATYGSGTNLEAVVGVTVPIGSNDSGMGELNRVNAEMQKYRTEHEIKLALSEKLAEALENGKTERAKVIAMMLAPLLGYKDYQSLLIAVSSPKTTNPQIGNR